MKTRRILQDEIIRLFKMLNKTIVFVTHDIEEAIKLGTRIILFNEGKIEQSGTKEEMIFSPKNQFVKDFFGIKNFTAYLNVVHIEDVLSGIDSEEELETIKSCSLISGSATIMEGIKLLFDNGVDYIGVEDADGRFIGKFSLKNLKQEIIV